MKKIKVFGLVSQLGEKFIRLDQANESYIVPLARLVGTPAEIKTHLTSLGLTIATNASVNSIQEQIESAGKWEPCQIAAEVGWNGAKFFVLPDMTVVQADGDPVPVEDLIELQRNIEKGDGKAWMREVMKPLVGQRIPTFAMCFSFMPPLLALSSRSTNVMFEIVSKPATGKTSTQQFVASVWGSPSRNAGSPYIKAMDSTVNGFEQMMAAHSDLPLVLDEANLFVSDMSVKARADFFRAIAFKLFSGAVKERYGAPARKGGYRLGVLISTNDPLSEVLQQNSQAADAAKERLLTVPIANDREFGVFDRLPEGFSSSGELVTTLTKAADENFGHAGRRFIERLVEARHADEEGLKKIIADYVSAFREKVGANPNDGSENRISEAFGLVYASGELAKKYQCLPKAMDCLEAVSFAYQLNREHDQRSLPFQSRLQSLIDSSTTLAWSEQLPNKVAKAQVILRRKKGANELWIRPHAINEVFRDWSAIKGTSEVSEYLHRESSGAIIFKRSAGKKLAKVKMYVFKLPENDFDL